MTKHKNDITLINLEHFTTRIFVQINDQIYPSIHSWPKSIIIILLFEYIGWLTTKTATLPWEI